MPNHCDNRLTATGPRLQIAQAHLVLRDIRQLVDEEPEECHYKILETPIVDRSSATSISLLTITAWHPLKLLPAELSNQFPLLLWIHDYIEEGNAFAGRDFYQNEDQLETRRGLPEEHPNMLSTASTEDFWENIHKQTQLLRQNPPRRTQHNHYHIAGYQEPLKIWATNPLSALVHFAIQRNIPFENQQTLTRWQKHSKSNLPLTITDLGAPLGQPYHHELTITQLPEKKTCRPNLKVLAITTNFLIQTL